MSDQLRPAFARAWHRYDEAPEEIPRGSVSSACGLRAVPDVLRVTAAGRATPLRKLPKGAIAADPWLFVRHTYLRGTSSRAVARARFDHVCCIPPETARTQANHAVGHASSASFRRTSHHARWSGEPLLEQHAVAAARWLKAGKSVCRSWSRGFDFVGSLRCRAQEVGTPELPLE